VPRKPTPPALFMVLAMPSGIMVTGVIGTVIGFLLRQDGVPVPRISQIISLLLLPGSLFFLWSPVTDFGLRRKHWFLLAAAIGATALFAAFNVAHLGSRSAVVLLMIAAGVCVLTRACDGGLMSSVVAEEQKTRVSGFHNSGVLFAGALGGAGILILAQHWSRPAVGASAALCVVLPALAVLRVDEGRPIKHPGGLVQRLRLMGKEFQSTMLCWKALPAILLLVAPLGSGAAISLLPSIAKDYGVSGSQVAWINGVSGSLLMAAGALLMGLLPLKVDVRIAFSATALINQTTLGILLLGHPRPITYLCGTLLFLLTIGATWALVTAVILKVMGPAGASGGTRFALLQSVATSAVASMAWIDGLGYKYFGPEGLPGIDMTVGGLSAVGFLVWFWWDGQRRREVHS
jgi:PAT family beta-lactamase induction signal transducer AmpG